MRIRSKHLTADQLAWCQQTMPAFAKAYADVQRRDAEVAKNRAQFQRAAERDPVALRIIGDNDNPQLGHAA